MTIQSFLTTENGQRILFPDVDIFVVDASTEDVVDNFQKWKGFDSIIVKF